MLDKRSNLWWFLGALIIIVLVVLVTSCGVVPDSPRPDRTGVAPRPAPDPSAMGNCGRDAKSVLLYVSWEHEYEKIIGYQDGTGGLRKEYDQRAQTRTGGTVQNCAVYRPGGVYSISADPKRDRERRGVTTCWILWSDKIQDRDTGFGGSVECTWWAR